LERALATRAVTRREARGGERLGEFGGVEIELLNPWPGQDDNEASVVMLLDYGDVEIILTGDIGASAERRILEAGAARDVEALKVAHHGSRSSSLDAFLDAFAPEIALVSAGRGNSYGHPTAEAIDRLESRAIEILRTDRDGTIRLSTDGREIEVSVFRAN
jgi:competence protein ComEC